MTEMKTDMKDIIEEIKAENLAFIDKLQDEDDTYYKEYNSGQNMDYDSKNDLEPNDKVDDDDDENITHEGDIGKENTKVYSKTGF
jgi:hypothetical protein